MEYFELHCIAKKSLLSYEKIVVFPPPFSSCLALRLVHVSLFFPFITLSLLLLLSFPALSSPPIGPTVKQPRPQPHAGNRRHRRLRERGAKKTLSILLLLTQIKISPFLCRSSRGAEVNESGSDGESDGAAGRGSSISLEAADGTGGTRGRDETTVISLISVVPPPQTIARVLLPPQPRRRSACVPLGLPILFIILHLCTIDAAISPLGVSAR